MIGGGGRVVWEQGDGLQNVGPPSERTEEDKDVLVRGVGRLSYSSIVFH